MLVSFKFKASTGLEAFILNGYLLQKSPGHFTLTRLVEIALGVGISEHNCILFQPHIQPNGNRADRSRGGTALCKFSTQS
jgi:hypothetical protein